MKAQAEAATAAGKAARPRRKTNRRSGGEVEVSPEDWDQLRAVAHCFWYPPGVSTSHLVSAAIQSYVREECARGGLTEAELTAMSPAQRKEFGDRWREEANAASSIGCGPYARIERAVITLDPRERTALEYFRDRWFKGKGVDLSFVLATVARVALLNPGTLAALGSSISQYVRTEGIADEVEFMRASLAMRKEYRLAAQRTRKRTGAL